MQSPPPGKYDAAAAATAQHTAFQECAATAAAATTVRNDAHEPHGSTIYTHRPSYTLHTHTQPEPYTRSDQKPNQRACALQRRTVAPSTTTATGDDAHVASLGQALWNAFAIVLYIERARLGAGTTRYRSIDSQH